MRQTRQALSESYVAVQFSEYLTNVYYIISLLFFECSGQLKQGLCYTNLTRHCLTRHLSQKKIINDLCFTLSRPQYVVDDILRNHTYNSFVLILQHQLCSERMRVEMYQMNWLHCVLLITRGIIDSWRSVDKFRAWKTAFTYPLLCFSGILISELKGWQKSRDVGVPVCYLSAHRIPAPQSATCTDSVWTSGKRMSTLSGAQDCLAELKHE